MKLPSFEDHGDLNALRRAMNAEFVEYIGAPLGETITNDDLRRLEHEGIEIPLENVATLPDGTLAYKGQRVILYIRDVRQHRNESSIEHHLPRFHVADCDKLREMRANKRFDRYVVTNRESGEFLLNVRRFGATKFEEVERQLKVCQFCLSNIRWEDFDRIRHISHKRAEIVSGFTLQRYFEAYGRSFILDIPPHTEHTAPLDEYTVEFYRIAKQLKAERHFQCEECHIDLTSHKHYLHAHHVNGVKGDNVRSNIRILCIYHHAQQPYHSRMKETAEYKTFVRQFGPKVGAR